MMPSTILPAVLIMAASVFFFFRLWDFVFGSTVQERGTLRPLHLPLPTGPSHTFPSVGCRSPAPFCSFFFFCWMHGFHVVPPSAPLNLRYQFWSRLLHQHSAHSMVPFVRRWGVGDLYVSPPPPRCRRCWCWDAQMFSRASCCCRVSPFYLWSD